MAWNGVLLPAAVACWVLAGAGAPVSAMPPGVDRGAMPMGQRSADAHFIVMMSPHHTGAITMAELGLQRSRRQEIRGLAERIRTSQSQENAQMRRWYRQWYGSDVPRWSRGGWALAWECLVSTPASMHSARLPTSIRPSSSK